MLYDSFMLLKPSAAAGVDGMDWHEYANDLDANPEDLLERLKTHRYRAKMIRRKYIPKGERQASLLLDLTLLRLVIHIHQRTGTHRL